MNRELKVHVRYRQLRQHHVSCARKRRCVSLSIGGRRVVSDSATMATCWTAVSSSASVSDRKRWKIVDAKCCCACYNGSCLYFVTSC